MKLGPLNMASKTRQRHKNHDDIMSANCDVIFPIFGQFEAVRKPDSGRMVCSMFSLIVTFYLTKIENRTQKSQTQLSYYCLE